MFAMLLHQPGSPLEAADISRPDPGPGEVLLRVLACAVCRTDLHVIDGDLPHPKLPLILGHEIVGVVEQIGCEVARWKPGDRVGVPWLSWTCGECVFCTTGRENLCDAARFTGYTRDGGFAEFTVADERFCFALPPGMDAAAMAPLLCAGLIGYRSLVRAGDAARLGIYGFGAAAHIVAQVARFQGREVYAFTKSGDAAAQTFARQLGAVWAGASTDDPPTELDAAIIFAAAGELVPTALRHLRKGGTVVCGGIHMTDVPSFPYRDLWGERTITSVANLTRRDGEGFLALAPQVPVCTQVQIYSLAAANEAIADFRRGLVQGAAVLVPQPA